MRVVLVVQLGWSGLLSASLAQLGVLVAHLDQSGIFGAWSTVARAGRGLRVRLHLLACERRVTGELRRVHDESVQLPIKTRAM